VQLQQCHLLSITVTINYYLQRHKVGVAGNLLMMVHSIVPVHGICLPATFKFFQYFWNGSSYALQIWQMG